MPVVSNYVPYYSNAQDFTEALIDLKDTIASSVLYPVLGFDAVAFENVNQGQALYLRASDGKVGKAIANDTDDKATVIGFAQTTKLAGEIVRAAIVGSLPTSGLNLGSIYYLSATSAGSITDVPPSASGHFVTRVGESASSSQLIIQLEPPIRLG